MTVTFLPDVKVFDLHPGMGNGPFADCLGVILHVNVSESGTPDSFWASNADSVCPNFQVFKDGSVHQMLPLNWQPWCQRDGNFHYAAIETAGMPNEPLTAAQVASCARIFRAYHDNLGVPLGEANTPGERGLGTHAMGGAAWGGHPCPGDIRSKQRVDIIAAAAAGLEFEVDAEAKARFDQIDAELKALAVAVGKVNAREIVALNGDDANPDAGLRDIAKKLAGSTSAPAVRPAK